MAADRLQVPHDYLDLRQPVDITSLAFLSVSDSGSHQTIAVGNTLGCVHIYDTRKGRKPAFSWSDSRMSGGISLVEKGIRDK
jgi:WD40 repeat protein